MTIPTDPCNEKPASPETDVDVAKRFRLALAETSEVLERLGFPQVLADTRDPVAMAHRLLAAPTTSSAFAKLWEMGRLSLSVEAIMLQAEFRGLFSETERATARERLLERGFYYEA